MNLDQFWRMHLKGVPSWTDGWFPIWRSSQRARCPRGITGIWPVGWDYLGLWEDVSCLDPTKNVWDTWWPAQVWAVPHPGREAGACLRL